MRYTTLKDIITHQYLESAKKGKIMKDGIHGKTECINKLSAERILNELYQKAKQKNNGKVQIREIKNGHVGDVIQRF